MSNVHCIKYARIRVSENQHSHIFYAVVDIIHYTKNEFTIKDFLIKCDQIRRKLLI